MFKAKRSFTLLAHINRYMSDAYYRKNNLSHSLRILEAENAKSFNEIKQIYYQLIKQNHPDVTKDNNNTKIKAIYDAYKDIEKLYKLNPEYFDQLLSNRKESKNENKFHFDKEDVRLYDKVKVEIGNAYFSIFGVKIDNTFKEYNASSDSLKDEFDNAMKRIQNDYKLLATELIYLYPLYYEYLERRSIKYRKRKGDYFYLIIDRILNITDQTYFKYILWFCILGMIAYFLPFHVIHYYSQVKANIENKKKRVDFLKNYNVPELKTIDTTYIEPFKASCDSIILNKEEILNLNVYERLKRNYHSKYIWGKNDKRERSAGLDESEFLIHSTIRKDITLQMGKSSSGACHKTKYIKHNQEELEKLGSERNDNSSASNLRLLMESGTKTNLTCIHIQVIEGAQEELKKVMVNWNDVKYQLETQGYYNPPDIGFQFKGNFSVYLRKDKKLNIELIPKTKISLYDLFFDYGTKIIDSEERNVYRLYHQYPPFINDTILFKITEKGKYFDQIKKKSVEYFKHSNREGLGDYSRTLREEIYEDVFSRVHKGEVFQFDVGDRLRGYHLLHTRSQLRTIQGSSYWDNLPTLQDKLPIKKRDIDPMEYFNKYGLKDKPPFTYFLDNINKSKHEN